MVKIQIDYRAGFPLPSGREVVERDRNGFALTGDRKLCCEKISVFYPSRFRLIKKGFIDVRQPQASKGSGPTILDYGVCYHLLDHRSLIPQEWVKFGKVAFLDTLIGWLHPYTGFILEHVVVEVPILSVSARICQITTVKVPVNESWNCGKIPVAAYKE